MDRLVDKETPTEEYKNILMPKSQILKMLYASKSLVKKATGS
jgi:hypothetical protein